MPNLTDEYTALLKQDYEMNKYTFISNLICKLMKPFCKHSDLMLVRHKTIRSLNPAHKNTTKEYQRIALPPEQHFYECFGCGAQFQRK